MQPELYADGISEITVTGSIVRLDLVSLSPTEKDANGQPVPEIRQRIVMSVEGFANSFEVLQKAMQGLIEGGAVRRVPADEQNGQDLGKPIQLPPEVPARRSGGSPNFA
ncbi:MAG: hypothetical protein ACTHLT_00110 [Devosia sp.]